MSSHAKAVGFSEVPKGRLIIWLVVAGELVIFGGGVVAFLLFRVKNPEIFDSLASLTSTPMGALNTFLLLTSSFLVVLGHHYGVEKNIKKMTMALIGTCVLGTGFLVVKSLEWIPKISHGIVFGISDPKVIELHAGIGTTFWSYYYFLTGMHAVHVILGMLAILIVLYNVSSTKKNFHRIEMVGIYWHFVDLVWIFLFPIFYLSR